MNRTERATRRNAAQARDARTRVVTGNVTEQDRERGMYIAAGRVRGAAVLDGEGKPQPDDGRSHLYFNARSNTK